MVTSPSTESTKGHGSGASGDGFGAGVKERSRRFPPGSTGMILVFSASNYEFGRMYPAVANGF